MDSRPVSLVVGAQPLTPADVATFARAPGPVALVPAGADRIEASWRLAGELAGRRAVYGRTTGVGANLAVASGAEGARHALRLLRSHACGAGPPLRPDVLRATMLIRLAQLAAGGSGLSPAVVDGLVAALNAGVVPTARELGAVGTSDLAVLASLGLALAGEAEWIGDGAVAAVAFGAGDALPLLTSNACTLAVATLAWASAARLLRAEMVVAALAFLAVDGNLEAYAEEVVRARPLPGLGHVAGVLRHLLTDLPAAPARLQDPFALRALPQVLGAAVDAAGALEGVLGVEVNAAAENPLISLEARDARHNANWHLAHTSVALDALRLALVQVAALAQARLTLLLEPGVTGLPPFLAGHEPASSGLMIAEYVAADAFSRLRVEASPATGAPVVLSRGVEEHASFAWQAAGQTRRALGWLRAIMATELVAAVRALRLRPERRAPVLAPLLAHAEAALPAELEDRPVAGDLDTAAGLLDELGDLLDALGDVATGPAYAAGPSATASASSGGRSSSA
jgi:histidine ammonia-lyase